MRAIGLLVIATLAGGQVVSLAQKGSGAASKGSDSSQSFISPLGMGTGGTVSITQNGTAITAAVAGQLLKVPLNFWQVGFSGTVDTNGKEAVYSTDESDAPAFKGKIGIGKSSFIRYRPEFTLTASQFLNEAWCRDEVNQVNLALPVAGQISIPSSTSCKDAVALEQMALAKTPPVDNNGDPDAKTTMFDEILLKALAGLTEPVSLEDRSAICTSLSASADFYQFCADSGKPQPSWSDQRKVYPGLDTYTKKIPPAFNWKIWANWLPILASTPYYPKTAGVVDLTTKDNWTGLLNTGLGDLALYYKKAAFGLEGGYGQTVNIKTENVCNTITSGTYTAQQCNAAMLGKPAPQNAWQASANLLLSPLPVFGSSGLLSAGEETLFSYTAPVSGGHSSELAPMFFISPSITQMSFVVGVQPTWNWNSDPKVGNKFSVTVYIGARPGVNQN
jgi:hypothetical protein